MARRGTNVASGRRGPQRYQYGNHFWVPETQADFSKGMVRDTAREAIPPGSVYDSADYLLHLPGVAQKRGGTAYAGPAMTAATYAASVERIPYASGSQILSVGDNGHLYKVTAGATTDVSTLGAVFAAKHRPVSVPSSGAILGVFLANDGTTAPKKWDGAAAANLGGTPPTATVGGVYKQRLVLANSAANPNRMWFSPVPSIEATWDTTNSYIDFEGSIVGVGVLNNAMLVFHGGSTERLIGAVPPPNSDMDRATIWQVGCTDSRSIVVNDGNCIFANPRGVYFTNGTSPVSLTRQGGIESLWQNTLKAGTYDASTWTIACGVRGDFLFVTVLDASNVLTLSLMCYLPRRAWWRTTNISSSMYSTTSDTADELYYADRTTNRVVKLSTLFGFQGVPAPAVKNDANGTAVAPLLEFAPAGTGAGVKSYGFGRIDYDMRDSASDNPVLAVAAIFGIGADTVVTPAESPLTETTTVARKRFQLCRDAQAVTVRITQTNASSMTEIHALEVEARPLSMTGDGVS